MTPAPESPPAGDTIAAIATAAGRGGVGVVRISGGNLAAFARALGGRTPEARRATLADFRAADGGVLDRGLLLYFPAPASFTGEDVLELHGHGGPVVLRLLLARCLELGARLAEPGEFTRRAFLNGKLDLAQAEAVADLIDAATAAAARSAVRSLQGEFSRAIAALVAELIELRALVEATLDFPEEEIDFLKAADAFARLEHLEARLALVRTKARQGRLLEAGLRVVLTGQPNVGKSSLLNCLSGEEVAIVTAIPGTTRDALAAAIQVEGVPLHIIDTAGLRETEDEVEKTGIARAWKAIAAADLALLLLDARVGLTEADRAILARLPEHLPRIIVRNKIDLTGEPPGRRESLGNAGEGMGNVDENARSTDASVEDANQNARHVGEGVADVDEGVRGTEITLSLSAKSGAGVELLRKALLEMAGWQGGEDVFIARERHLRALAAATQHLETARREAESPVPALELFAENLRLTQTALATITGEFTPDDLLGEIFGRFCIGK
ncbi:MAG: tRNA uridine-5-carboxymethylaminomethyl(34) synthesis GTPase MnmE [Zoogloeaceae bacterium]|jgi:tRNA modification GTPase|nr:tRNA uridine-5-carboxymethylaminomethyl(34) synthesis GTPase MnmE [Zoogloeaceae bacterium]